MYPATTSQMNGFPHSRPSSAIPSLRAAQIVTARMINCITMVAT